MSVASVSRNVVRVEYTVVRAPLGALDTFVVSRLPQSSPVRVGFSRGLAALDAAAARFLAGPQQDGQRGGAGHSGKNAARTTPVPASSSTAGPPVDEADTDTDTDTDTAEIDEDAERERIAEAILEEEQEAHYVGELAEADEDDLERQAELRAKHQLAEEKERREADEWRKAAAEHDANRKS